jgi:hypothetical protein
MCSTPLYTTTPLLYSKRHSQKQAQDAGAHPAEPASLYTNAIGNSNVDGDDLCRR